MNLLQTYADAFSRAYPQAAMNIRVKPQRNGPALYVVSIDGSEGEPLTETDIRGAIARFAQHGRPVNARGHLCNL